MAKYRKKPVVVEAVRVTAADVGPRGWDGSPFSEHPAWLRDAAERGKVVPILDDRDYARFSIRTLEGTMTAEPGDWIIQGIRGELYPCKPDIFEATYEPVENLTKRQRTEKAMASEPLKGWMSVRDGFPPSRHAIYAVYDAGRNSLDIDEWVFFPFRQGTGAWGWESCDAHDFYCELPPLPDTPKENDRG